MSAIDRNAVEAIPLFLSALEDPDPVVVRNAVVALAFFKHEAARPGLLQALSDPDSFRRWEVVFSLKEIGNAEVIAALVPMLDETKEPAERVRSEVALALGVMGGVEEFPVLLETLLEDPSHSVRIRAAMAFGRIGDASIVDELEAALCRVSAQLDTIEA